CIPETCIVMPEVTAQLRREQQDWVVKFAGYDRDNQAWGGRSLRVGAHHSRVEWAHILDRCLELPWPVVAQRVMPSARIDIAYADADGSVGWMRQGATRLRSFILRDDATGHADGRDITVAGSHVTVSSAAMQVSEGIGTVQAPVVFHD